MATLMRERVTSVHHWTDRLFSFKTTRDPSFRFEAGQFAMIGLVVNGNFPSAGASMFFTLFMLATMSGLSGV